MKLSRLMQIVEAGPGFRPDDSGIRLTGVKRKPDKRMGDFPYDREITYGQPGMSTDRSSNSAATSGGRAITPKDDETFSLTLMDLENVMKEILDSPVLMSKGNSSQMGSSVPGANGGWANNPVKSWDDEDTDPFDKNDVGGTIPYDSDYGYEYITSMHNVREVDNQLVDPRSYAKMDFHVISPDPWSTINQSLSSRGLVGRLPRESAWDRISGMTLEPRQKSET